MCRYNNEKAVAQRNLHVIISLVTFLANSALASVILSSKEFRKQVNIFKKEFTYNHFFVVSLFQIPQRSNVFMVVLGVSDMVYVLFFNLRCVFKNTLKNFDESKLGVNPQNKINI